MQFAQSLNRKQIPNSRCGLDTVTQCLEMEPNPSKDRAMHEGDNPSFSNEFIELSFFLTLKV
jgi:hypothetical protein